MSNGKSVIEKVELNLPRGMARLSGSSVQDILENTDFDKHVDDWVEVTLPWSERGTNPLVRMQTKFPYTCANIKFHRPTISGDGATITEATDGESVGETATKFFENVAGEGKATTVRIAIVTENEKIRGEVS